MLKFFKCNVCGNIVELICEGIGKMSCCGRMMEELIPSKDERFRDKHVPYVLLEGSKLHVKIGGEEHPMEEGHHVVFIAVETNMRVIRKNLKAGQSPCLKLDLKCGEKLICVYEYCNIHGLFITECHE